MEPDKKRWKCILQKLQGQPSLFLEANSRDIKPKHNSEIFITSNLTDQYLFNVWSSSTNMNLLKTFSQVLAKSGPKPMSALKLAGLAKREEVPILSSLVRRKLGRNEFPHAYYSPSRLMSPTKTFKIMNFLKKNTLLTESVGS